MLLSYRHKFIFIHVWKVAGMSIQRALAKHAEVPNPTRLARTIRRMGLNRWLPLFDPITFDEHIPAADLRERLPATVFNESFKFAFVRNPWDLEVSLYHFTLSNKKFPKYEKIKSKGSFDAYIEWRARKRRKLQKDFVTDAEGRLLVDFVGRFERLQEDFQYVCSRIGVDATLPHVNASKHRDYRSYYTTRTMNLLKEAAREDIELFGYEFDAPCTEAMPFAKGAA